MTQTTDQDRHTATQPPAIPYTPKGRIELGRDGDFSVYLESINISDLVKDMWFYAKGNTGKATVTLELKPLTVEVDEETLFSLKRLAVPAIEWFQCKACDWDGPGIQYKDGLVFDDEMCAVCPECAGYVNPVFGDARKVRLVRQGGEGDDNSRT